MCFGISAYQGASDSPAPAPICGLCQQPICWDVAYSGFHLQLPMKRHGLLSTHPLAICVPSESVCWTPQQCYLNEHLEPLRYTRSCGSPRASMPCFPHTLERESSGSGASVRVSAVRHTLGETPLCTTHPLGSSILATILKVQIPYHSSIQPTRLQVGRFLNEDNCLPLLAPTPTGLEPANALSEQMTHQAQRCVVSDCPDIT